jgi:hypothetical protein
MIFLRFAANGVSNVEVAAAGTHDRLMIDASVSANRRSQITYLHSLPDTGLRVYVPIESRYPLCRYVITSVFGSMRLYIARERQTSI